MDDPRRDFEPGEYRGGVRLPGSEHRTVFDFQANQAVTFFVDDYPSSPSHGGFPKPPVEHSRLTGWLSTNHDVVLHRALLEEYFPGRTHGWGTWTVVGLGIVDLETWERANVSVSGLEAIIPRPIDRTEFPNRYNATRLEYRAEVVPEPIPATSHEGVTALCRYDLSASVFDQYEFGVRSIARCGLSISEGLSVGEWMTDWALPLADLVGLATGRAEHVSEVKVQNGTFKPKKRDNYTSGSVFGPRIEQRATWAERPVAENGRPIAPLFTLNEAPPLAELIARSRRLASERTALSLLRLAHDSSLPTSVTFTLLAQAVEALHRDANRDKDERSAARYATRRTEVLNSIKEASLTPEHRFLKRRLGSRPLDDLAGRFRQILRNDAFSEVVENWDRVTRELDAELRARTAYKPHDLAKRLATTRNVLSHGAAVLPARLVAPGAFILDVLARVELLRELDFTEVQLQVAVNRAAQMM